MNDHQDAKLCIALLAVLSIGEPSDQNVLQKVIILIGKSNALITGCPSSRYFLVSQFHLGSMEYSTVLIRCTNIGVTAIE